MTAKNHHGWQVESFDRKQGWRRASKVHADYVDACSAYDQWPIQGVELRIMEALEPAPLTAAQYIKEAFKRVKRFYRWAR